MEFPKYNIYSTHFIVQIWRCKLYKFEGVSHSTVKNDSESIQAVGKLQMCCQPYETPHADQS